MNISMMTSANSMNQIQHKLDSVSNNLANQNTTGYKRTQATFQDLLTQNIRNQPHSEQETGRSTPYGIRVGHGAKIAQTSMVGDQGAVRQTDREMDWMVEGENGWFRVLHTTLNEEGDLQEEIQYTRNGHFHVQPHPQNEDEMRIVTAQGDPVLDENDQEMSFSVDYDRIQVSEEGIVSVFGEGEDELLAEFSLTLAHIHRADVLEATGDTRFRLSVDEEEFLDNGGMELVNVAAPEDEERAFSVRQGALEASNVEIGQEMTEMLKAQRMLQFQSRAMTMADEMMGLSNSIRT